MGNLKENQLMNRNLTMFWIVQAAGVIFYSVLSAAYFIPFPDSRILIGEPIIHLLMSVFGGVYLLLTVISLWLFRKQEI